MNEWMGQEWTVDGPSTPYVMYVSVCPPLALPAFRPSELRGSIS